MRDISSFKERFRRWKKTGELPYEAGRIKNADSNREELVYEDSLSLSALPAYEGGKDGTILNYGEVYESSRPLPTPVRKPGDMYDYQRAAELGYKRDATGHFSTRDYQTGRYLKNPTHPTLMMSVVSDLGEGYYPYYNKEDGLIYSDTWMKIPEYSNGKDGTILNHDYANDMFTGARLFDGLDIVVTGSKKNIKRSYMHPWKTIDRVRQEAFDDEVLRRRQELAALGMSNTLYNLYKNDLSKPLSPVDPFGEFVVSAVALDPAFKYLFSGTGEVLKDIAYKTAGKIKPLRNALISREMGNAVKSAEPVSEDIYGRQLSSVPVVSQETPSTISFFDAKNKGRLVDKDGNVNMRAVANLVQEVYKNFPGGRPYKQIMNSSGNLYDHTKAVVKSAQQMELPVGVSRLELVESALIHDFGKILDRTVHHDWATEMIMDQLGLVDRGLINQSAVDAAAIHMDSGIAARSNLARGLHFADVARGLDLWSVLDANPHLAYPINRPLVNPNLPRDTKWQLQNIINPLIDRYGYKLSEEERSLLGLPKYIDGPQIPIDTDENIARNAVLHILKRHRTFERTSHYPSDKFEDALKQLASQATGKPIDQVTTEDMFDTSALFIKNHGTNSGTVGLDQYLHTAQLNHDEYLALYNSTRDATALHYARLNSGKPYRMDLVQMNVNDDPSWSLAELWANNEFPVVSSTGNLSKDMRLSNFRKYELPYILNTGKQDYAERVAEIGKKYYRQSYIEAPDMPNYARPITDEPGRGGILLQKVGRNPNPEVSRSRIEDTAADINDMLKQFGLSEVSPKIIKSADGQEMVVSYRAYNELYRDLDTIERIRLSLEDRPIEEWEPFQIRNLLGTLQSNGLITKKLYKAAVFDLERHLDKANQSQKAIDKFNEIFGSTEGVLPPIPLDEASIKLALKDYDALKYIGGVKQWASKAKSKYFSAIHQDNSRNAFFKKRQAEKIVKGKASKEIFEDGDIHPYYSLESPDGYRVFTTEPGGFREGPDPNYTGGSHYVIVGPRGSKQLNVIGRYTPTQKEIDLALGGSHGGRQSGQLSKLSRNFGGIALPIIGSWYLTSKLQNQK